MRFLIIRHADPDYTIDSLTEKGWHEAEFLAQRLMKMNITAFYVSPLGRAKDTANVTLKKMNRVAEEIPWLKEFHAPLKKPHKEGYGVAWDWLPELWTKEDSYYDKDRWNTTEIMQGANVKEEADKVAQGLDEILKRHGYEREGRLYKVVKPSDDIIVFFCHFGVECIMLGHLLGISPMVLWHGLCAAPSSVTTVISEERRRGIASFRMNTFGDISHLYANDEPPAFAARFCEQYDNEDERHD
jgi:broad specificity phosphatase PhoE